MISDVGTARQVLDGMQALLDQAELPWSLDERRENVFTMRSRSSGSRLEVWNEVEAPLIVAAVNGWPALISHARDVLDQHRRGYVQLPGPYDHPDDCARCCYRWPCPDVLSILALLTPYETLGEGGKQ